MEFNEYFQNELIALRKLGQEAASRNPGLASFFNTPGRDPDVERLLEGFAFLGGRLRQKLDDELPEITHGLFSRLWPNYLRSLPAASIIQYQPTGNVTGSMLIPKGALVESVPVEGTRCAFHTIYDTEILPLKLTGQRFIQHHDTVLLALSFAMTAGSLGNLPLSRLRFFLTGKESAAHTLHYALTNQVKAIRFIIRDEQQEEHCTATLEPSAIRTVGFQEEEGLYPYSEKTELGYRIMQEYFSFPEKFLFAEVSGLERGLRKNTEQNLQDTDAFELHFVLQELPDGYESFSIDNWKLFCTPVVNLFPVPAVPIVLEDPLQPSKIVPKPHLPEHFAVYSVDRVSSWGQDGKEGTVYENFDSFDRILNDNTMAPAYHLHIRPALTDEDIETYITVDSEGSGKALLRMQFTCTNRMLPKRLGLGDLCVSVGNDTTSAIPFKNILPVTTPYPPPLNGDLLWRLLSNMSLNTIPLSDVKALRSVISTYNFRAIHEYPCAQAMGKKLEGIVAVSTREMDRIFKGLPVRGAQTTITLNQKNFSCEGALYLFGSVLDEFLGMYATVNSFQQLIIVEANTGKKYQWPARLGRAMRR